MTLCKVDDSSLKKVSGAMKRGDVDVESRGRGDYKAARVGRDVVAVSDLRV